MTVPVGGWVSFNPLEADALHDLYTIGVVLGTMHPLAALCTAEECLYGGTPLLSRSEAAA